jgi:hypothetical protein
MMNLFALNDAEKIAKNETDFKLEIGLKDNFLKICFSSSVLHSLQLYLFSCLTLCGRRISGTL